MLGELGKGGVEWDLDRRVKGWGKRLLRKGEGEYFGKRWREREKGYGCYESGWAGRMFRRVGENKLEGEKWDVESERLGNGRWKVWVEKDKEKGRERWERGRGERERRWLVGVSDASGEGMGIGIGGGLWEGGEKLMDWRAGLGRGLDVSEGEMWGVRRLLEKVRGEYNGMKRKLIVGVDNVGVLKRRRKGRGMCGEGERGVRRMAGRLMEEGWEGVFVWWPGHVGIKENEEADELASERSWEDEEDVETKDMLVWGKWEQRRKEEMNRSWKEYWVKRRKGEEYFGVGGKGELGHGGSRSVSRFLMWMRTNHGGMGGSRYGVGRSRCECGGVETRDHILQYCGLYEKERKEVWKGWWGGFLFYEEWIEMERLLFSEDGVKRMVEFAKRIGGFEREWKEMKIGGGEERRRMRLVEKEIGGGGWMRERSERRRMEVLERAKLRMRRNRKRKAEEEGRVIVERNRWGEGERRVIKGKRKCLGALVRWNGEREGEEREKGEVSGKENLADPLHPMQVEWFRRI